MATAGPIKEQKNERKWMNNAMTKRCCWHVVLVLSIVLGGCASKSGSLKTGSSKVAAPNNAAQRDQSAKEMPLKTGWTTRVVTTEELLQVGRIDPALTPAACKEILARLNAKAPYRISDDIRNKRPLKAPNDFRAYKDWTPLPKTIPQLAEVPKAILIVKESFFMGWYERGRLVEDTYACIGRPGQDTEVGMYKVEEKDPDHVSRSYSNSFGEPAWMPWAMRIYDHVWIHAGDVTGSKCSHGCIILPVDPAQEVYVWSDRNTKVVIVDSLKTFPAELKDLIAKR